MKDSAATMRHRPDNYMDAEPQLQKPQFARQMSAQQARNSPTVEQMRRLQIAHEQGNFVVFFFFSSLIFVIHFKRLERTETLRKELKKLNPNSTTLRRLKQNIEDKIFY